MAKMNTKTSAASQPTLFEVAREIYQQHGSGDHAISLLERRIMRSPEFLRDVIRRHCKVLLEACMRNHRGAIKNIDPGNPESMVDESIPAIRPSATAVDAPRRQKHVLDWPLARQRLVRHANRVEVAAQRALSASFAFGHAQTSKMHSIIEDRLPSDDAAVADHWKDGEADTLWTKIRKIPEFVVRRDRVS